MNPIFFTVVIILHVLEELLLGFAPFFNREIAGSNDNWRPIGVLEATLKDCIGLAGALIFLAFQGAQSGGAWMAHVLIGFLAADAFQHSVYSFSFKGWTPGMATALGYYWLIGDFFLRVVPNVGGLQASWLWFVAGAAGLAGNWLFAMLRA